MHLECYTDDLLIFLLLRLLVLLGFAFDLRISKLLHTLKGTVVFQAKLPCPIYLHKKQK